MWGGWPQYRKDCIGRWCREGEDISQAFGAVRLEAEDKAKDDVRCSQGVHPRCWYS